MVKNIISEIIRNNAGFVEDRTGVFEKLREGQSPNTTLIMCSDSRVPTCVVKKDTINQVFCIENIGNQIRTAEGSVDYGIHHLKTPLLLVLGHTNCGAIKACFSDFTGEPAGIQRELEYLSDGLAEMDNGFSKDDPERLNKYSEINVDYQVKMALRKYGELVKAGRLTIVGMMMDFTDSYSKKKGSVFITNINGMTDAAKIAGAEMLDGIGSSMIKRLT